MMDEFDSIKKEVLMILESEPETRNSDKLLIFRIINNHINFPLSFEEFNKLPNFETIRRMRQKIQEENDNLKPDSDVQDLRDKRREELRILMKPERGSIISPSINLPRNTVEVFS